MDFRDRNKENHEQLTTLQKRFENKRSKIPMLELGI